MTDRSIEFKSERVFHKLYCEVSENILAIEKAFQIKVVARGNVLHMEGRERHC